MYRARMLDWITSKLMPDLISNYFIINSNLN
uniref:Uncharacterized protein n=1 Tax=Arundo donax TaxID=35708 RepID=A0A0A9CLW8_ARUDO